MKGAYTYLPMNEQSTYNNKYSKKEERSNKQKKNVQYSS